MRLWQFFEGEDGRLSMTRLIVLMTFLPATWVLLDDGDQLANYLGFYVGGYAAGKASDVFMKGNGNVATQQLETTTIESSSSVVASVDTSRPPRNPRTGKVKRRSF